jgi:NADPH:quinone reductase-like Zn-dependent oxidoreductase
MTDQAGSMQAIVFDAPGGPEVLHTTSLDVPVPEATQVRLRCEGDRG